MSEVGGGEERRAPRRRCSELHWQCAELRVKHRGHDCAVAKRPWRAGDPTLCSGAMLGNSGRSMAGGPE